MELDNKMIDTSISFNDFVSDVLRNSNVPFTAEDRQELREAIDQIDTLLDERPRLDENLVQSVQEYLELVGSSEGETASESFIPQAEASKERETADETLGTQAEASTARPS